MIRRCYLLLCIGTLIFVRAVPGLAQPEPASIADVAPQIDAAGRTIDAVTAADAKRADDAALAARIAALQPADQALDAAVATLTPRLLAIDARLGELGPAPATGQPAETAEIATERVSLLRDRAAIAAEAKQASLLIVELDQLVARLEQERRALFARDLWAPSRSLLSPDLWRGVAAAAPGDARRLSLAALAETRRAAAAQGGFGWLLAALVAAVVVIASRGWLVAAGRRRAERAATRLGWSLLALWHAAIVAVTAIAAAWLVRCWAHCGGGVDPGVRDDGDGNDPGDRLRRAGRRAGDGVAVAGLSGGAPCAARRRGRRKPRPLPAHPRGRRCARRHRGRDPPRVRHKPGEFGRKRQCRPLPRARRHRRGADRRRARPGAGARAAARRAAAVDRCRARDVAGADRGTASR